jgi:hypothetical protein
LTANLAPQTEHFPSAVIFGCSFTSAPHKPHFTKTSPPQLPLSASNVMPSLTTTFRFDLKLCDCEAVTTVAV